MKKLYHEFFCIPEQGKISDKVLLVRMVAAAMFMVLCLCGMSASAYAYFACNVSSTSNIIQAAEFKAEVTIKNQSDEGVTVSTEDNRTFRASLPAGQYTVALTPQGTAATGFFIITVGDKEYCTQQLVENGEKKPLTFTLMLADSADVELLAHWGTVSSYPKLPQNSIDGVNNQIVLGEWTSTSSEGGTEEITQEEPSISEHTVLVGETAESIAQKYNVSVDKLLDYNEITDASSIKEGDSLRIPPVDWEPETNNAESENQTEQTTPDTTDTTTDLETEKTEKTEGETGEGTAPDASDAGGQGT